jgi:SAM-dependent methyltransferase
MPEHDYMNDNRALWDELTPVHARSGMYNLENFKRGKTSLAPLDLEELGSEVTGKSLLHLQCHFGKDTLSWARLGAHVTGADFSEPAIALAQSLTQELGLDARFVCANLYDLPNVLTGQFDVVYTGVGAICWLPDIARWAEIVAHFLKPGGIFYIRDGHPVLQTLESDPGPNAVRIAYPYFQGPEPLRFVGDHHYADPSYVSARASYEWIHPLGSIVTALINAGLEIVFLHEFPCCEWQALPFLERDEQGIWHIPASHVPIPLSFSIKAIKR